MIQDTNAVVITDMTLMCTTCLENFINKQSFAMNVSQCNAKTTGILPTLSCESYNLEFIFLI